MQLLNKTAVKKTIVHTWYIYPILAGIVTVIWLWAFYAFHQPSKHQLLTLFFSARVNNTKFVSEIMKNYKRENLRSVSTSGVLKSSVSQAAFSQKLLAAINDSDLLILDKTTIDEFQTNFDLVFYNITENVKDTYITGEQEYYTYTKEETTYTYGVKLNKEHYADYLTFDEFETYYICVCKSSVNCGELRSESNKPYDNALTFMNYLLQL